MRRGGLWLLLLVACTAEPARLVSLSELEDTRDATGPYVVQAELRGPLGDDRLIVCWATDGEHFRPEVMQAREGRGDLRFAALPGQPVGTTVTWFAAIVGADESCPEVDEPRSFRVLGSSLACEVDSDCRLGAELCADGTCREWNGTCAEGGACPGGYVCDEAREPATCVIPARACTGDDECPPLEQCDATRGECVARP